MSDVVKVTYNGIEIAYDERRNVWSFELRGRCRSCESLALAKEAIDTPVKSKAQPFSRVKAFLLNYSEWLEGEITSIAEGPSWDSPRYVWFTHDKTKSKERADQVYPVNDLNSALVAQHKEAQQAMRKYEEKANKILESMKSYEIPKEEA